RMYRRPEDIKANLLRGAVFCAHCGESMTPGITPKKTPTGIKRYFYYRCDTSDCERRGKSVRAHVIVNYVCEYLEKKPFSTDKAYKHYVEEMALVATQRMNFAKSTLRSLQAQK